MNAPPCAASCSYQPAQASWVSWRMTFRGAKCGLFLGLLRFCPASFLGGGDRKRQAGAGGVGELAVLPLHRRAWTIAGILS